MQMDAIWPENGGLVARVVATIVTEVRSGAIRPSGRLPSERACAQRLNVSRNTVTAAYGELERRGIIRRLHGKGSFLCALPTAEETFSWSGKISRSADSLDEPVLELLARRCSNDIAYPLSAGTPSLAAFPAEIYSEFVRRTLLDELPGVFAVAPTEGQWRLRKALAEWLHVQPQNVMITAGAQEGIDLLARCLIEPGDAVVVESPTYAGAIQSFRSAGAQLVPWSAEWPLGELENLLLRHRPKLLFVTPTFQNPTGRVMTQKTREGLLSLAYRYRVPVIEDDVYAQVGFGGEAPPASLYRQDTRSQVVSLSTFSKMLAPGLRIGWLLAPSYMVKQLSLIKMRSNLFTGGLNQLVLSTMLREGEMERHLTRLRPHHAGLCDAALHALRPALDEGLLHCRAPRGGLYLWCRVGFPVDLETFFAELEERGVSVAPGSAFVADSRADSQHFRICFTACEREALQQGLHTVVETLREMRLAAGSRGETGDAVCASA
ncbi:PLP-dependent aminotransferase family protein [Terriglobus sp.]|uniref:aminotransferase-like domain-containing protein n=1 Tax=Terriglobus sp. TaxID=1889013 RepID=UPI003B00ED94